MHNKTVEPAPSPPGWVNFNEPLGPATYSQSPDAAPPAYTAEAGKPAYNTNMQHAGQYEGQYGGQNSGQYGGQYGMQHGTHPDTNTHMMSTSHTVTAQPNIVVINPLQQLPVRRAPDWMVLSCFVFWCCNCLFGAVAFWFSHMSERASDEGDENKARHYGKVSLGINICSIITTILLVIIPVIIITSAAAAASNSTDDDSCNEYCGGECCTSYETCYNTYHGYYCS